MVWEILVLCGAVQPDLFLSGRRCLSPPFFGPAFRCWTELDFELYVAAYAPGCSSACDSVGDVGGWLRRRVVRSPRRELMQGLFVIQYWGCFSWL
jgi:hypothetical protein